MANELSSWLSGGNVIHEGATAIRTFTLTSGGDPVDLTDFTAFRSDVRPSVGSAVLYTTATMTVIGDPTLGVLEWRLTVAETNEIVSDPSAPTGTANVPFVMDIEGDKAGGITEYLGHGAGSVQRKVTVL